MTNKINQDSLIIINRSGIYGKPLYLATVGGSGNGKVSYIIVNAGNANPILTNNKLIAQGVGTFIIKATKEGDNSYNPISSVDTHITFIIPHASPVSSCCMNSSISRNTQPSSSGYSMTPIIIQHPESKNVKVGSNVIFSVIESSSSPITYQWYKNTIRRNIDTIISNADSPILKLENVTKNDEGDYYVVLKNSLGQITMSNFAKLTIYM